MAACRCRLSPEGLLPAQDVAAVDVDVVVDTGQAFGNAVANAQPGVFVLRCQRDHRAGGIPLETAPADKGIGLAAALHRGFQFVGIAGQQGQGDAFGRAGRGWRRARHGSAIGAHPVFGYARRPGGFGGNLGRSAGATGHQRRRFDMNIAEDLVEEIARIYGYDNIRPRLPEFAVDMSYDDTADLTHELKLSLAASGYFEAVSFSFSDAKIEALFNDDKLGSVLPLANPISADLAVMRRTLLSSLLPVVSYNLNRQQSRVRLFETGLSFVGQDIDNLVQTPSLAMVATGLVAEEGIYDKRAMDFFDLKRDVESLLPQGLNKTSLSYERADLAFLHPGQSAYLVVNGARLGWFGQLHPTIAKALDLPTVWVGQFAIEDLIDLHRATNAITAPSKFPSVRRDLAFLVDTSVEWQDFVVDIRAAAGKYLTDLWLFDVYQGDRLPEGKKSLAFAMLFQNADATLEDDVIKKAMDDVASRLSDKHGAKLRDS